MSTYAIFFDRKTVERDKFDIDSIKSAYDASLCKYVLYFNYLEFYLNTIPYIFRKLKSDPGLIMREVPHD